MEKMIFNKSWLPLWNATRVMQEISEGVIFRNLNEAMQKKLAEIADIKEKVISALTYPKPLDISMPVLNAVLAAQYYEVFEALSLPKDMSVYEPCVGASDTVIIATEAFSAGKANYFSLNLNRKLREQLQSKVSHLKIPIKIIEDNALKVLKHLKPNSFDVACFHHAINDILQTAVSEMHGMDTTSIDWFPNEQQMIEWLAEDVEAGLLDKYGRSELMQIIGDATCLVRPGGFVLFDHWNWCSFIGIKWFPWDLFYNLIPMTREWIVESNLPLSEVHMEGIDPQWWLIFRVI